MSISRRLLAEYFECLECLAVSIERLADLFAEDGVLEMPFSAGLGMPSSFQGKADLRGAFEMLKAHFPGFALANIDVHELKSAEGAFAQFRCIGFVDGTDKIYAQDYVSQLMAEGGKIKLLRQYCNSIDTARLFFPKGLADVPEAVI